MQDPAAAVYRHNIKAAVSIAEACTKQIILGNFDDRPLLSQINVVFSAAESVSFLIFDFNKYNRAAVFHDQVDLSASNAEVRLQKTVAFFLQKVTGGSFKTAADFSFIHFSFPGVTVSFVQMKCVIKLRRWIGQGPNSLSAAIWAAVP